MSCMLLDPRQIFVVVNTVRRLRPGCFSVFSHEVVQLLHEANVMAVNATYPHLPQQQPMQVKRLDTSEYTTVIQALKYLHCLGYNLDQDRTPQAHQLVKELEGVIISHLDGYESAHWTYEPPALKTA